MIVAGSKKAKFEFLLVKKPQFKLIYEKKALKKLKKLKKPIKQHITFSPLSIKEKSLYNAAFLENIKIGGVV